MYFAVLNLVAKVVAFRHTWRESATLDPHQKMTRERNKKRKRGCFEDLCRRVCGIVDDGRYKLSGKFRPTSRRGAVPRLLRV